MIKGKSNSNPESQPETQSASFKENPEVNAKIDDYIKSNPKHWDYIQSMSPDRMARTLVLGEIQKQDRTQKMETGILRKLEQNPEMKEHIESIVKKMPESQRERATISIARSAFRATAEKQQQSTGRKV